MTGIEPGNCGCKLVIKKLTMWRLVVLHHSDTVKGCRAPHPTAGFALPKCV